jgi:hypothetical protein
MQSIEVGNPELLSSIARNLVSYAPASNAEGLFGPSTRGQPRVYGETPIPRTADGTDRGDALIAKLAGDPNMYRMRRSDSSAGEDKQ